MELQDLIDQQMQDPLYMKMELEKYRLKLKDLDSEMVFTQDQNDLLTQEVDQYKDAMETQKQNLDFLNEQNQMYMS